MGIEDRMKNHNTGGNGGENQDDRREQRDESRNVSGSGFGGLTMDTGSYGIGSGNTALLTCNAIAEIFKKEQKGNFRFYAFDNNAFKFDYSFIAAALPNEAGDRAHIYIFLLAETGSIAQTAAEFIQQLKDKNGYTFTYDGMIDNETIGVAKEQISKDLKLDEKDIIISGCSVVEDNAVESALEIANIAVRNLEMAATVEVEGDLNLAKTFNISENSKFEMAYQFIKDGVVTDSLGKPVAANFCITLTSSVRQNNRDRRPSNRSGGRVDIAKVYGVVEYSISDEKIANYNETAQKFTPHIVVTEIKAYRDTFNYGMIGMLAVSMFDSREIMVNHLLNCREDLAYLTYMINPGNSKDPVIPKLENVDDSKIIELIDSIGCENLAPMYSIDIPNNGTMEFMYPLIDAVVNKNDDGVYKSMQYLTDGNINFDGDIIDSFTTIPKCTYHSTVPRDTRSINVAQTMKLSKCLNTAYEMNNAYNADNAYAMEEVLEALVDSINDCTVVGTISRIGVNSDFISEILEASEIINNVTYAVPDLPDNIYRRSTNTVSSRRRTNRRSSFAGEGNNRRRNAFDRGAYRR